MTKRARFLSLLLATLALGLGLAACAGRPAIHLRGQVVHALNFQLYPEPHENLACLLP